MSTARSEEPQLTTRPKHSEGFDIFGTIVIERGIVSFSETRALLGLRMCDPSTIAPWEAFDELNAYNGTSSVSMTLLKAGLVDLDWKVLPRVRKELKGVLTRKEWRQLQTAASTIGSRTAEEQASLWIVNWANRCAEPLTPTWLASMALQAHVSGDEQYAFGYLTALLDQANGKQPHYQRGKNAVEAARRGGLERARQLRPESERRLAAMARLVQLRHTVARAGELAHRDGAGVSGPANVKLWNRHQEK